MPSTLRERVALAGVKTIIVGMLRKFPGAVTEPAGYPSLNLCNKLVTENRRRL